MIDNKIDDEIENVLRISPQNSWEKVERETENIGFDRKIPKERNISPERRQWIIDKLWLI